MKKIILLLYITNATICFSQENCMKVTNDPVTRSSDVKSDIIDLGGISIFLRSYKSWDTYP